MSRETDLKSAVEAAFPSIQVEIRRDRRLYAQVPQALFPEVLRYLYEKQGYIAISTILGLDDGESLAFQYFLNDMGRSVFTLCLQVPKMNPVIQTITGTFPGAVFYERELVDLLGAVVEGLPPGDRYPLRDDWPKGQYPLRKDWKPEMLEGAFKESENA